MDNIMLHYLIPVVFIRIINHLAGNRLKKSLILLLSPIAFLPDMDYFFFYHRATFHNLFFGLLVVLAASLIFSKWHKKSHVAFIAAFFFMAHIVLDSGAVIWFYPLTKIGYSFSGGKVTLEALQHVPHFPLQWWITASIGVIMLFALLLLEIILENKIKKNKK